MPRSTAPPESIVPAIASFRAPLNAALAAHCALVLLAGCGEDAAPLGPTARVERADIERIVVATGTIEPQREVEVRSRIPGIVERIHVVAGDSVVQGQPLVEIERELLDAQVREAEAALEEAEVELRFAQIGVDRVDELERGGAASTQKRDDAHARHQRAQALVARARANRDTLATQLSYATVRSPMAGRVLDVHTEEGNAVSPVTAVTGGTLLLSLAGTDALLLEGLVDENEVARIALDQAARIRTEAFGDRVFPGRVSEIAPMGKRIQNVTYFEVKIEIDAELGEMLRPRMSGDAEIVAERVKGALVVPETALRYSNSQIFVDTVRRASAREVVPAEITIGIVDGDRVQVLDGVDEGTEVLLQ